MAVAYDFATRFGPLPPLCYVYFIRQGARGPVKIGHAKNPDARIRELQTGASERLELLLKIPGHRELEERLHREFSEYRLKGEWFRWCRPIQAKVKELRALAR